MSTVLTKRMHTKVIETDKDWVETLVSKVNETADDDVVVKLDVESCL